MINKKIYKNFVIFGTLSFILGVVLPNIFIFIFMYPIFFYEYIALNPYSLGEKVEGLNCTENEYHIVHLGSCLNIQLNCDDLCDDSYRYYLSAESYHCFSLYNSDTTFIKFDTCFDNFDISGMTYTKTINNYVFIFIYILMLMPMVLFVIVIFMCFWRLFFWEMYLWV